MKGYRTLAEAAKVLGVLPDTLRQQALAGKLVTEKVGTTRIVSDRELERYRRTSLGKPGRRAGAPAKPRRRAVDSDATIAADEDDGAVLIAGVLYDAETLEEAQP